MNFFGIRSTTYRIDASTLNQFSDSFFTFFKGDLDMELKYIDNRDNNYFVDGNKISIEEIETKWNSIITILDTDHELDIKSGNKTSVIFILMYVITALNLLIAIFGFAGIYTVGYCILSFLGLLFALRANSGWLKIDNTLISSLCKSGSKNTCDRIGEDPQWKFFKVFDFSLLSLIYFSTQYIIGVIAIGFDLESEFLYLQIFFSAFTGIAVVLSIIYQWKTKEWCKICLGIIGVILVQICLTIYFNYINSLELIVSFSKTTHFGLTYLFLLALIAITIIYLKETTKIRKEIRSKLIRKNNFIRNSTIFNRVMNFEEPISIPRDLVVQTRNLEGNALKLICITSLECKYCKDAFIKLKKWKRRYSQKIEVTFLFNTQLVNKSKEMVRVYSQFQRILDSGDNNLIWESLSNWYDTQNSGKWLKKFEANINRESQDYYAQNLREKYEWCQSNEINFTPALIMGNRLIPGNYYSISDLEHIIPDLV